MNQIWQINADIYLEIYELAVLHGKKPGESMEEEFKAVMKKRNIKPIGNTELTTQELLNEYRSHGTTILDLRQREHNKDGK